MHITVAICTRNRSALLNDTLALLAKCELPPDTTWELLVVDNNSTDDTAAVLRSYLDKLPLRMLFQPEPGQSHARNMAIAEARGEYIIWTDDDVHVGADWLLSYVRAFREQPNGAFFGGPIEPFFDYEVPKWFEAVWPNVQAAYAARPRFDTTSLVPIQYSAVPFGANMVIRTDHQRQRLFNTHFGLKPGSTLRFDETPLLRAMIASGLQGYWVPNAIVQHYIPADRVTEKYLSGFYFGLGQARGMSAPDAGEATLFGYPRWMVRQCAAGWVRYRLARASGGPGAWIEPFKQYYEARGALFGVLNRPSPGHAAPTVATT